MAAETEISKAIGKLLDMYEKQGKLIHARTWSGKIPIQTSNGIGRVPTTRWFVTGRVGWPDRTVMLQGGGMLGIEVKTSSGKQSPEQKKCEEKILALGGDYLIARSVADVKEFIDDYIQNI